MAAKHSAEGLSRVPTRLMDKRRVLDKLHSGTRPSAVGCEFDVHESTTYSKASLDRNTH